MSSPFQLWPAIDLLNGKPVRLLQGDYDQKTEYDSSLVDLAKIFSSFASGIHLVDLQGAKEGTPVHFSEIEKIVNAADVPVEVGGGIRTLEDIEKLLSLGVYRVILGTSALQNPEFLQEALVQYGVEKIVVGVDAKDGFVATHGWEEKSSVIAEGFLKRLIHDFGVRTVIYTDISTDGTLAGPPLETFSALTEAFPELDIIASGGVAHLSDIISLEQTGARGVIFGKAYYEGNISLKELSDFHTHA